MPLFRVKKKEEEPVEGEGTVRAEDVPREPNGFFDLPPEEVANFKAPGVIAARRKPLDLKPALKVFAALVVLGAIVAGVIVLMPSSRERVPDLLGRTLPEALDAARGRGLTPRVTGWEYSEKHSDGVVLAQSPRGGKLVMKGSGITITLSKGSRPETGPPPGEAEPAPPGNGEASAGPLSNRTITIDPGHQAVPSYAEWSDPGMTRRVPGDNGMKGVITGNEEYLVTLDTGLKLKNLLEKDGIRVVMTRETSTIDLTNVIRAEIANNAESDLCVRIHCGNSTDPLMMGIDTLYPARDRLTEAFYEKSKTAALIIQAELIKSCGTDDLGVLDRHDMPGFNWSKVPVVEAETGFLTNPRDDGLLSDEQFRWKVAWGLRNGVIKYLNSP